jgi:hypothetical protein
MTLPLLLTTLVHTITPEHPHLLYHCASVSQPPYYHAQGLSHKSIELSAKEQVVRFLEPALNHPV